MSWIYLISTGIITFALGIGSGVAYHRIQLRRRKEEANTIIENAKREAKNLKREKVLEGRQKVQEEREKLDRRIKDREEELERMEKRLTRKEDRLGKKSNYLEKIEDSLREDEKEIQELKEEGQELIEREQQYLEKISGLTTQEAKEKLTQRVEKEAERHFARKIEEVEKRTREIADSKARRILATAVQRYAAEQAEENSVTSVPLPSDDYKGRVIGRNGRNIKTFEALTGVEVLVDDTPEMVVLSCFHPVRREIARLAMEALVEDGRIHPVQIEEKVEKARRKMVEQIKEEGQKAALDTGVELPSELIPLVGKLKYRDSYGQNQLRHSLEVSFIGGIIAEELDLSQKLARRAGLIHDIGKAVDHEVPGSHAEIGAELARRYGESEQIVNAIEAHHEDVEPQSILPLIIQAADTLSATRPGARQETYERYIERLERLEEIGRSFDGVKKAFALQAGREIRIVVEPEKISDESASKLAFDVAREVEKGLDYPGEVKINVIRKAQFVECAQ
ncbi:MAG: ribonuclease Y [Candidatus Acetothermia bacterium]